MKTEDLTAPSYEDRRPYKSATSKTFPVYPDPVDRLVEAKHQRDDELRFVMAVGSSNAYADTATVAMMMARQGLEENHCFMVTEDVDVLFLTSTAGLDQGSTTRRPRPATQGALR